MDRIGFSLVLGLGLAFAAGPAGAAGEGAAAAESAAKRAAAADSATAAPAGISLARLAVCIGVEERTPVGEADSFPCDVGKLWCFTWVQADEPPVPIYHRWYVGDRLVDEIPIDVKGRRWRCWSRKTIVRSWRGPCRVEIVTEAGEVLGTKEFTLTAPAPGKGAPRGKTEESGGG